MDGHPPVTGLTSAEVAGRVARGEVNETARRTSRPVSDIVRANVLTRFNAIIGSLCAVVLAAGRPQDALFGLVMVANTGIGVVQELRAKATLDRLAVLGEEPVRVVRDGRETTVRPQEIVLGDHVLVSSGDRIMVDGELAAGSGLEADESLLTGESDPVAKRPGDQLLSGSFVVSGSGAFTVTRVGAQSYAARLEAEAATFNLAQSELMAGINRFLRIITWIIIPVAVLLTASQLVYAKGAFPDAVAGAVAGIVTMIPEGLVLLTSVAFAVGVIRLGRRRCLVQQLPAIEVLARVDVLCLDKTGTLTEGGMELDEIVDLVPGGPVREILAVLTQAEERPNATLQAIAAGLAGAADSSPATSSPATSGPADSGPADSSPADSSPATSGPTDSGPTDSGPTSSAAGHVVRVVPFSSARKWSGAVLAGDGEAAGGWVLGAPEVLLRRTDPAREAAEQRAAAGLRVLALGRADPQDLDPSAVLGGDGRPVTPVALLVLRQRLRAEAARTLAYFAEEHVAIKVISGDSAASVGAIARELGVGGADHPVDARTLPAADEADLSEADLGVLADILEKNSVFGRVTPRQKQAFVTALRSRGHTVGMTGDGVNDVLALSTADLGVAMGSGSGATRAVAKVVLMNNNFDSLPHVVAEGRRVLGNIERVASLFLTKTIYAMLLSSTTALISFAALAGLAGLRFPFLPRHLTLISTLTIGVPAFVLALAPNRQRAQPGFVSRVLNFAIPAGIACAAATFTVYVLARLDTSTSLVADRTTAVIALSTVALWVLALVARPYTWWRIALVVAMAGGTALALGLPLTRTFFELQAYDLTSDLEAVALAAVAGALLTMVLAVGGWLPRSGSGKPLPPHR